MRLVLVVDNILEVNTRGSVEFAEKLLVEDESDARDLLDACLRFRLAVHQIGSDGNGQSSAKLFPLETCQQQQQSKDIKLNIELKAKSCSSQRSTFESIALAVGTDEHVELVLRHRVIGRTHFRFPSDF